MSRDNKKSAAEAAYSYLASRMRTTAEVVNHLKDKGYDAKEVADAVSELTGMRYLDDYQYALRYYEYNREKKRGSLRAARELAGKGVDADTIRNAREDFIYTDKVDEYSDALAAAERELRIRSSNGSEPGTDGEMAGVCLDDKLAGRIARMLDTRGFDRGDIFRVLDELRRRYGSED